MITPASKILKDHPAPLKSRLIDVRSLVLEIAETSDHIGVIEESVKWGQLSFATVRPKSGTPLRLGGDAGMGTYSLFVPCSTRLISDFRDHSAGMFDYHGNREIRLNIDTPMPKSELSLFISATLSYYVDEKT